MAWKHFKLKTLELIKTRQLLRQGNAIKASKLVEKDENDITEEKITDSRSSVRRSIEKSMILNVATLVRKSIDRTNNAFESPVVNEAAIAMSPTSETDEVLSSTGDSGHDDGSCFDGSSYERRKNSYDLGEFYFTNFEK